MKTYYECEVCLDTWSTKEECGACEDSHCEHKYRYAVIGRNQNLRVTRDDEICYSCPATRGYEDEIWNEYDIQKVCTICGKEEIFSIDDRDFSDGTFMSMEKDSLDKK